jgi:hypothetical protein
LVLVITGFRLNRSSGSGLGNIKVSKMPTREARERLDTPPIRRENILRYLRIRQSIVGTHNASCVSAIALTVAYVSTGLAQTDEIQVYDAAIAPTGAFNLTLHNNFTPSGAASPDFPGGIAADKSLNGVAEWAYGVAPWFEAGLYFPLYSLTRDGGLLYNGFKLRTLFVTPDAAKHDFFYGVNFEFSFNTAHWDPHTYSAEIRPIIGRHVGDFDFIFNPIVDTSWNGVSKLEFVPETRVAKALSDKYKLAIEEYDDFGAISHFLSSSKQSHQLFGVLDINTSVVEIELGVGAGLTTASDHRVIKLILSRDL